MAITANRSVIVEFTGDLEYTQQYDAQPSNASPGQVEVVDLAIGNNTITVPSGAVAVTIVPASDNDETLRLKGVNGDTGINLSMTDPTSIGLDGVSSFVLNAGDDITVRLIYS